MQYTHIFGYRFNISSSYNSITTYILSSFKRILLLFGLTFIGFSTIRCELTDANGKPKLTRQMLQEYLESLENKLATGTNPDLREFYEKERRAVEIELLVEDDDMLGEPDPEDDEDAEQPIYLKLAPYSNDFLPIPNYYNPQQDIYNAILPATVHDVNKFIDTYKRKLPSVQLTKKIMKEAKRQYPNLRQVIRQLRDMDEQYARVKYPSRLLFVGPSGCGKTTTAEALAKYCGQICIFIKASSIATTYQNSGAQFFDVLFRCLKENKKDDFLVIIDEISLITQMSSDGKDEQQNKMATAFWLALDEIRDERHICVIGTTNSDPKTLPEQLKTRFANNIYHFEHPKIDTVVNLIKDNLNFVPKGGPNRSFAKCPEKLYSCSDALIQQLAGAVSHLSLREIEDLVEKAKAQAITEMDNPYALVTSMHLQKAFAEHTQSWYTKAWQHKAKYFKPLVSFRALTLYTAVTGLIMHFYTDSYKEHGLCITAVASLINNYLPRPHGEPNDTHVFSNITHWFTNYKYSRFSREPVVTS